MSLEAEDNNTKFFGSEKYRPEVLECMSHTKYLSSASKMSSCSCVNSGMCSVVQWCGVERSTVPYSTVQCSAVQYILSSAPRYRMISL